jgi:hypothetical protein
MESKLKDLILEIKSNDSVYDYDEATTRQTIILRLFSFLGWDIFNADEVKPEYSMAGKRVDYALRISSQNKIFIEVKQIREDLEKHQEQLLKYSFQEGVKLAILTNGITWWFYLPLNEGGWEQRRFYTIDLLEQSPQDVSRRSIQFLAKENIDSGTAITDAEDFYRSQQRKKIVKETVPKAWHRIISEPDDLLVDLVVETAEKLCGFRPDEDYVKAYIREFLSPSVGPPPKRPEPPPIVKPPSVETEDFTGKKPYLVTFLGTRRVVGSWKEVIQEVCDILYERRPADVERFLKLDKCFSRNRRQFHSPREIASTGIFVETNRSADAIMRMCWRIIGLFGHQENDLEVLYK